MTAIPRFGATETGALTPDMATAWERDGTLVVEGFASASECAALLERMDWLIDEFDPSTVSSIFETGSQSHAADAYFQTSGDKVRFFFEKGAFDASGALAVDKHKAINKIGHALHDLDPVFETFSRQPRLERLTRDLGLADPGLVQSMLIVKPPRIGGEVNCHQDATFLYTDPVSCTGLWFALEDATLENGCLQAVPGAHRAPLKERFHYDGEALVMDTLAPQGWADTDAEPLEVPAGSLVVLHGLLPHMSGPNTSEKSRRAYALHVVDRKARWADDNWLRRAPDMPVRGFDLAA